MECDNPTERDVISERRRREARQGAFAVLGAPPPGLAGGPEIAVGEFAGADGQRQEILVLFQRFRHGGTVGDNDVPFPEAGLSEKTPGCVAEDLDTEDLPVYFQFRQVQRSLFVHVIPQAQH